MKKPSIVKFRCLSDLALFLKTIQPNGYTINTVRLTLAACFTPTEQAIALNNYRAEEVKTISA